MVMSWVSWKTIEKKIKAYNIDKNEALFKISQPDSKNHDKDYYAWVEYTLNETETPGEVPTGNIGGIKETDVFDNIQYGD